MPKPIIHRRADLNFDKEYDKHWHSGSPFKTHFLNSLNILFPIGEQFFIRSIKKVLKQVDQPGLKEQAINFIKQETEHTKEHTKFLKILKKQGYKFEELFEKLDNLFKNHMEPLAGENLNLAVTSGLEHITALFSEISLSENFMEGAPKELKDLFDWHAAEEIEHRAVAFDVLNNVSSNFALRVYGLVHAYFIMSVCSSFFTVYLLHQDKLLFNKNTFKDFVKLFFIEEKLFFKAISIFFRYLDPNFHPDKEELSHLGEDILNSFSVNLSVVTQ
jgi:uncharacterized protein